MIESLCGTLSYLIALISAEFRRMVFVYAFIRKSTCNYTPICVICQELFSHNCEIILKGDVIMLTPTKELGKKNKISILRLEEETGITKNTISRWNNSTPSVDKVKAVADYFGVSVDYLLTGRETMITAADASLLRKWHSIDEFGRSIVQTILDGEVYRCTRIRDLEDKERTIPIMRSVQPASAGTGIEIGIADMEIVHIPDSPDPIRRKPAALRSSFKFRAIPCCRFTKMAINY